jgi:hypothetical protein
MISWLKKWGLPYVVAFTVLPDIQKYADCLIRIHSTTGNQDFLAKCSSS